MTVQVPVRLTSEDVSALDKLIADGSYKTRSEVLRTALAALLHELREQEIDEAYRRGYGKYPQEDWIGEAGMAALSEFDRSEDGEPL